MIAFQFEESFPVSKEDYVALHTLMGRQSVLGLAVTLAIGIACLFWSYTVLLGSGLIAFAIARWVLKRDLPGSAGSEYRERPHLSERLTYGVSDSALWVRGDGFETRFTWAQVYAWNESDRLLWFSYGFDPGVYLPVESLKRAGCYERIIDIVYGDGSDSELQGRR